VRALTFLVVLIGSLWALVLWMQPRMAFFPTHGIQATPAADALSHSDVQIGTADGITLHGWWLEHPSPRGQVLYWHGNGGNLSMWLPVFADIRRRGFSVLAVDYRGYGASSGTPSETGIYRDAEAVLAHFEKHLRREQTPVIYWGRSLGSTVASFAAAKSAPDALILESAFPDARSLFAGNPLLFALSIFSTYRFATAQHLEGYRGPLLIVHGDADTLIPFAMGRKVFEGAGSIQKTFAALEGAAHNDSYASHQVYWPTVDRFLEGAFNQAENNVNRRQ